MSYFGIPLRNGLPIGLGSVAALSTNAVFNPISLFANGEQGWIYNPSDFSTLFQDSAGTTPVTAVEQPVGLQLDLSKGGVLVGGFALKTSATGWNAAFSSSTSSTAGAIVSFVPVRGGLEGMVGLSVSPLAGTSFTTIDYAWYFNAAGAPGATKIYESGVDRGASTGFSDGDIFSIEYDNTNVIYKINGVTKRTVAASPGLTFFVDASFNTPGTSISSLLFNGNTPTLLNQTGIVFVPGNHRFQNTSANRPVVSARVNLFVGTETLATQSVTTRAAVHTLTFTGAGSITLTGTAIGVFTAGTHSVTTTAGSLTATVLGAVTQADLRETNVGVGLPAYQAVVTSTNYTSTGFPIYIKPNGSNQFMQTNSINFTATDKMTVWQGVRKVVEPIGFLIELGTSVSSNNGSFYIAAGNNNFNDYGMAARGTTTGSFQPQPYSVPITNVLATSYDFAGTTLATEIVPRVNGVVVQTVPNGSCGTGNFGNYPAYFYARAGTSLFFGGNDYGSIARGAASTATQITDGETWVNNLSKAY